MDRIQRLIVGTTIFTVFGLMLVLVFWSMSLTIAAY